MTPSDPVDEEAEGARSPDLADAGPASDVVWLVGTGYATQVATLVMSISLRGVLGPAAMGFVALVQLVASYAPFLTLGTDHWHLGS